VLLEPALGEESVKFGEKVYKKTSPMLFTIRDKKQQPHGTYSPPDINRNTFSVVS